MADSAGGGKGDGAIVSTEVSETNDTSSTTFSVMDVDPPKENENANENLTSKDLHAGGGGDNKNANVIDKEKSEKAEGRLEEDEFLVLEEDDGGDEQGNESTAKINESFNTPEPEPMDAASSAPEKADGVVTKTEGDEATKDDNILVNPLFGKPDVPVPLIDIESSSSSSDDDSEEEDFSLDVTVNNFQQSEDGGADVTTINGNTTDGSASGGGPPKSLARGQGCGCDCYHEKGILVNEIERLRQAVFELSERHGVLEDFIEVEYSESFDKFLKNREHLVSMGFGGKDSKGSGDIIDGKRSSKSAELIELLKMIKDQASANVKEEPDTNSTASKKTPASTKGSSNSSSQSSKNQSAPKSKSIPTLSSQRDRGSSGRGGALGYSQRPVILPGAASNAYAMNYQYQQNLVAQQEAQARQYYNSMYGHAAGSAMSRDSRDYISAVGRTELYPSSSSASYGYGGYGARSDSSSNKEPKKQRKRKRKSEVSSEGSSRNVPGAGKDQQSGSSNKKADDDDDIEIIDYNSQSLNVNTKRICPLCEKIVNRKGLRDHLSIVHQGNKVACPVCQAEFMHRRRIKTHMRDAHDLPVSEYSAYIDKIYSTIEEQCGPWLDKLMQEAETPTKDQLIVHNAEIQLAMLAKREERAAANGSTTTGGEASTSSSSMKPPPPSRSSGHSSASRPAHSSSSSSGRRDNRDNRDRGSRGGSSSNSSQSQSVRYFTGANTRVSSSKGHGGSQGNGRNVSSADLYGPGGYAQYAARYLQQRAATETGGVSRIYTPF